MTKQVRDWQEDKRYLEELNDWGIDPDDEDLYKIASYYHERADKLKTELREYTDEHWKSFEREKKLREAIKRVIFTDDEPFPADYLESVLASLYPEEETK